jgi:AAA ATPase domain
VTRTLSEEPTPLVGRERELAELEAGLVETRSGRGRLFFIAGEPGIGKTRLAEAVAARAAGHGMIPLWGRAWESAGAPAFWPWTQLLRSLTGTRDSEALSTELGAGAPWLAQVLPELTEKVPGVRPPRSPGAEKARFALFDAVATFLRDAAASDPLVVVLDDLHAADPASLLLFEFVARAVADSPILLVATFQEAAAHRRPELEKLIGALGREGTTVVLRGLGDSDLAQIVELHTGRACEPPLLKALRETTEGNPFFATEVLRLVPANGELALSLDPRGGGFLIPGTVRETVRRRFESLDQATIATLEAASVIGREFRLATLMRAMGESERLVAFLDLADAAGLIVAIPGSIGRYQFTHNLIRETLYAGLATERRIQLHRAIGEAIAETFGDAPDRLAELAHHFAQASPGGDVEKALDYATKAGREAMRLFAYEQAAGLFRLALEMAELCDPDAGRRAELLLALGRAHARADHTAARETLIEAGEAARAADDPRLMAEAGLAMRAWPRGGGVLDEQPGRLLQEALERLDERDSELRARVLARLAAALYYWAGTEERRKSLVEEAVAIARRLGDPATLAHVLSNCQLATWGPDYTERDLDWMEEVLGLLARVRDDTLELGTRNRQIDFLLELGDLAGADAALRHLELTVRESSDPRTEGYVHLHRARQAIVEGRYAEAARLNAQAMQVGSRVHDSNMIILARNQVASMRWLEGRFGEIEAEVREVAERDVTPAWPAALARIYCDLGMEQHAERMLERMAVNDFADLPRYNGWLITLALLAETCVHLGDLDKAETLYKLLLPFAGRNVTSPQAVFIGPISRFLGILAATRSEWDAATSHFSAARKAAERMNSPAVELRVALDEAEMLARRGQADGRRRAIGLLEQAAPLAASLGVDGIGAQIVELRRNLGVPASVASASEARGTDITTATLRREGESWTFEFARRSVRVRDSKGVRYIAALLRRPGVEIHALDLAGADSSALTGDARSSATAAAAELHAPGDAGPLLDAEAKSAYRNRLEELREDLEEATAFNDPERAAAAREEIDFLERELAGAVGLGGRDRRAASSAERARVSVTKAIRTTIKRVGEHDPILARELEATIRTGAYCMHQPDPRHPLGWRVDLG